MHAFGNLLQEKVSCLAVGSKYYVDGKNEPPGGASPITARRHKRLAEQMRQLDNKAILIMVRHCEVLMRHPEGLWPSQLRGLYALLRNLYKTTGQDDRRYERHYQVATVQLLAAEGLAVWKNGSKYDRRLGQSREEICLSRLSTIDKRLRKAGIDPLTVKGSVQTLRLKVWKKVRLSDGSPKEGLRTWWYGEGWYTQKRLSLPLGWRPRRGGYYESRAELEAVQEEQYQRWRKSPAGLAAIAHSEARRARQAATAARRAPEALEKDS